MSQDTVIDVLIINIFSKWLFPLTATVWRLGTNNRKHEGANKSWKNGFKWKIFIQSERSRWDTCFPGIISFRVTYDNFFSDTPQVCFVFRLVTQKVAKTMEKSVDTRVVACIERHNSELKLILQVKGLRRQSLSSETMSRDFFVIFWNFVGLKQKIWRWNLFQTYFDGY